MAKKYLDSDGLLYVWNKIKATFALKSHTHTASEAPGSVTGVKGNSESSYRTGDVNLTAANIGAAPTSHASTATTYGSGTSSNYGHVKLSDATDGTAAAASGGTAATPKAVSDALTAAKNYADSLDTGVTGVKGNSESSYRTGDVNLTAANIGAAPTSHVHGNITNGGDITASAPTIASGDKIIINDESASKITNGPSFGADTTKFLRNDGNWAVPLGTSYSTYTPNISAPGPFVHSKPTADDTWLMYTAGGWASISKALADFAEEASGSTPEDGSIFVWDGSLGQDGGAYFASPSSVISDASTSSSGLMSSADKTKLNNLTTYSEATTSSSGLLTWLGPTADGSYLASVEVVSGVVNLDEYDLSASDIPDLPASKITRGTLGTDRIPSLAISKITNLQWTLDGKIATSAKGAANGVCPLNASSKIDATYLPSYVDDVIEAYARSGQTALSSTWLATDSASGTVITPEAGKIYVLMADSGNYAANTQFRWGGSAYVKLADGGVSSITNAEIDTICV